MDRNSMSTDEAFETLRDIGEDIAERRGCPFADVRQWVRCYSWGAAAMDTLGEAEIEAALHRGYMDHQEREDD